MARVGADAFQPRNRELCEIQDGDAVRSHHGNVGDGRLGVDGNTAGMAAHFDPGQFCAASGLDDTDIETAPIGHEQQPIVGSHGQVFGYRPDRDDPVHLQGGRIDPVYEALIPPGQTAPIPARSREPRPVHLVVRYVAEGTVAREGCFNRSALIVALEPEFGQLHRVGDRLHQLEGPVVHRDGVPVHHVLGEEQTVARVDDRFRG